MQKKKVLVGLSGGVDSAVTAYLLLKEGYDVSAGFMINYYTADDENCTTKKDLEVAREVSEYLKIPFFTFDYVKEYDDIILKYIYEGYQKGLTPNPDVFCNSEVKFKLFLDEAMEAGFDYIATGHYARIYPPKVDQNEEYFHLLKWVDTTKDQSYFLSFLNQYQLSKALFPIGHLEKTEVRKIAEEAGLPNATRKDSQGLCFVGKVDFKEFLEKKIPHKTGDIVDMTGKKLWEHDGVFFYTIGQRKGLRVWGLEKPIFVVDKNVEKNLLIVTDDETIDLTKKELICRELHFVGKELEFPFTWRAKIRYRQEDQECVVTKSPSWNEYCFTFKEPQRAITSGQVATLYDWEELVASGVIQ